MEEKALILSIDFQTDEAMRRSAALRDSIDADRAALQELNKTIKESGQATAEQALQREKLEQTIRENSRARQEENRSIDSYIRASKASFDANGKYNGSIKDMRAQLSFLTSKWNELTREQRENGEEGGKLQSHIKSLSDELKQLEGSVGDNRRSVGGYLDAIKQAPGFMGKMSAGMQGLNGVMAANPIGMVVQLLNTLMPILNSSGDSADFLAKTMSQINAVIQVGMKYLIRFGKDAVEAGTAAFEAFKNPKQILTDIADFIQTNLMNRVKSFAVVMDGIKNMDLKKVTDGVIQMGTGVTDATSKIGNLADMARKGFNQVAADIDNARLAGGRYAEALDDLEAKERAFGLASAETEAQIDKLVKQSKNRTLSDAEREAKLAKAGELEIKRNKQELALAEERVKLIKEQNKLNQEDSDVQDERLKEAQTRVVELGRQSTAILEKIQNSRDALKQEILADFQKDREAAQKWIDEFNKTFVQSGEDRYNAQKDQMNKSKDLLDKQAADVAAYDKAVEDIDKKDADRKKKKHEAELQMLDAGQALFSALAKENANFAEFEKALALFRIGLASAEAITKGIKASADAGPFPLNLVAIATTVATIGANLLQAKQLIDEEPPKPPQRAAEGGLLQGPSHAEGGIRGTGAFGNVEVEGGEAIINKRSTAMFAGLLNAINIAGGGRSLSPTGFAAAGGLVPMSSFNPAGGNFLNQSTGGIDYTELAGALAKQPIYVRPTEIVNKANSTNARKVSTTIG